MLEWVFSVKRQLGNGVDKAAREIAYRLPDIIVHWCIIRALGRATTGQWSATVVEELRGLDVLERWQKRTCIVGTDSPSLID